MRRHPDEGSSSESDDGSSDRREHSLLNEATARARTLAAQYYLPPLARGASVGTKVMYVLTLRRGTERAISHWSHCMNEAARAPRRRDVLWGISRSGHIGPQKRVSSRASHSCASRTAATRTKTIPGSDIQISKLECWHRCQLLERSSNRRGFGSSKARLLGLRAPVKSAKELRPMSSLALQNAYRSSSPC